MTEWVEVFRAPIEQDLAPFSRYLLEQGVASYVFERSGEQCLCVPAEIDPTLLRQLIEYWHSGNVDLRRYQHAVVPARGFSEPSSFSQWRQFPLTLALLSLSAISFFMVATPWGESLGGMKWLAAMTFQSVTIDGENFHLIAALPPVSEWWRYWSPVFLHFSGFHILFNGLMLLEMGRRIEIAQGVQRLLFLVMACGLISNLTQFYTDSSSLFGGMSGVIYALVGYGWLYQKLRPAAVINIPPGLMAMAFFWLVLCISGIVTMAGMGKIANAAHIGGLVAGWLLAWLLVLLDERFP
jgi:GlpG protein